MPGHAPTVEPTLHSAQAVLARRRTAAGLVVAGAVAALLTIVVATSSDLLAGFDTALTDSTRGWADPLGWPVDVAHVVGLMTAPVWSAVAATVLVIALLLAHHRAAAGLLALSGIAGVLVSESIKTVMGRARPPGAEQFEFDLDKSFPSGHAMVGIYLYLAAGLVLVHLASGRTWMRLVGRALIVAGPLIGLSRLILGVHWPTDIIAGWAFGSVVLLSSALLLWWPLDRGWAPRDAELATATPPALPEAGTTPDPPAR
jgi:undecaprenyl-diphosphatase